MSNPHLRSTSLGGLAEVSKSLKHSAISNKEIVGSTGAAARRREKRKSSTRKRKKARGRVGQTERTRFFKRLSLNATGNDANRIKRRQLVTIFLLSRPPSRPVEFILTALRGVAVGGSFNERQGRKNQETEQPTRGARSNWPTGNKHQRENGRTYHLRGNLLTFRPRTGGQPGARRSPWRGPTRGGGTLTE